VRIGTFPGPCISLNWRDMSAPRTRSDRFVSVSGRHCAGSPRLSNCLAVTSPRESETRCALASSRMLLTILFVVCQRQQQCSLDRQWDTEDEMRVIMAIYLFWDP
jgi:hypothetical protein